VPETIFDGSFGAVAEPMREDFSGDEWGIGQGGYKSKDAMLRFERCGYNSRFSIPDHRPANRRLAAAAVDHFGRGPDTVSPRHESVAIGHDDHAIVALDEALHLQRVECSREGLRSRSERRR
jgi:hypothetical protein